MTEQPQDAFVGMIGHELRSPLTSVLGYAQLLGTEPLTDEQHRYVDVIERNGRRLLRLIDELLVSAQLSAGEADITRADVELARVSRTCGDELAPTARAAGLSLTVTVPGPVLVRGDPALLAQMVTSLLGHAVALTPRGGAVAMRLGLRDGPTAEAVIEVADTGAGIGPDELARLTERLYRTRATAGHDIRGIGLGLPVVQAIVDAHGGTMSVDNPPGGGTRVTVTLPTGSPARPRPEPRSTPR